MSLSYAPVCILHSPHTQSSATAYTAHPKHHRLSPSTAHPIQPHTAARTPQTHHQHCTQSTTHNQQQQTTQSKVKQHSTGTHTPHTPRQHTQPTAVIRSVRSARAHLAPTKTLQTLIVCCPKTAPPFHAVSRATDGGFSPSDSPQQQPATTTQSPTRPTTIFTQGLRQQRQHQHNIPTQPHQTCHPLCKTAKALICHRRRTHHHQTTTIICIYNRNCTARRSPSISAGPCSARHGTGQ